MQTLRRIDKIFGLIILVLFVIVYSTVFDKKMDMNGDNYAYLNYATSIVHGNGYTSPYNPTHPATNFYPVGYPAILAFFMAIFGKNIILFKILNGIFYAAGLFLFYFIIRDIITLCGYKKSQTAISHRVFAFSIALLLIFNSELMRFSTIIMSEIPYLFFSLLAFYFLLKEDRPKTAPSQEREGNPLKSGWFYGIILASSAAYYMRGVGLTLAAGIGIYYLFSKKWNMIIRNMSH